MKLRGVALAAMLLGCGGEPDPMLGTWEAQVGACGKGLIFEAGDRFAFNFACGSSLQAAYGTYSIAGGSLTLSATHSSCPNWVKVKTVAITVAGDTMTIADQAGGTVYQRTIPAGGSGSYTFGCFDSTGTFTPSPISPL